MLLFLMQWLCRSWQQADNRRLLPSLPQINKTVISAHINANFILESQILILKTLEKQTWQRQQQQQ